MRQLVSQRDRPPRASGVHMTTYAIRQPWIGRRVYYHETAPHWRSTPPLPGHRLSREETRRLAGTVGGLDGVLRRARGGPAPVRLREPAESGDRRGKGSLS